MATPSNYERNVFINCPFDASYDSLFEAIVFTVFDCGFLARCALEEDDAGGNRFDKIVRVINECKYGIHDLSKADLDAMTKLARFNMPLELGLFLGAHRYASARNHNRAKRLLVMDTERARYRDFISDLSGQDIKAHGKDERAVIENVRDFLDTASRKQLPGPDYFFRRFQKFKKDLPRICQVRHWNPLKLTFVNRCECVAQWIAENPVT